MTIVKGKTEGEHKAEQQAIAASIKSAKPREKVGPNRRLREHEVKQVEEALRDFEETKGDFAKDH
jgi:hypothetical protein